MSTTHIPAKTRISVARYQQMVATGVLTKYDRIELIDGEMIDMAPNGRKHVTVTNRLNKLFVMGAGDSAIVSPGGPVNLGDYSEPEPDLSILRPRADDYATQLPEGADVLLLIEVSDTSLAYDQGIKRALYARHGISEYWIVDVEARCIHVHREPDGSSFSKVSTVTIPDRVAARELPGIEVSLDALFA
jgi:Uma2 family endonuclease